MSKPGFMWECSCGFSVFDELEPEECTECGNLNTFIKMPEEIVEEREKELFEEQNKPITKKSKSIKQKKSKSR